MARPILPILAAGAIILGILLVYYMATTDGFTNFDLTMRSPYQYCAMCLRSGPDTCDGNYKCDKRQSY